VAASRYARHHDLSCAGVEGAVLTVTKEGYGFSFMAFMVVQAVAKESWLGGGGQRKKSWWQ